MTTMYGEWVSVPGLDPGDFAYVTKWKFTPGLINKLVYICGAGPGRQRDFWIIGSSPPKTVSISADFLSPVTVPLYRLSLLERLVAETWMAENEIATLVKRSGSENLANP